MKSYPVIFILGPTAIGKTDLAIRLARKIDAEIVSADSRQIYKYMNIGTAKPSLTEQGGIVHHLLDTILPTDSYNAGRFAKDAGKIIDRRCSRQQNTIVCGGTGLYVNALVDGIAPLDFDTTHARMELEKRFNAEGLPALYQALTRMDPQLAARLNPNDKQRILRGLEVVISSGKTLSEWHKMPTDSTRFSFKMFALTMSREKLYARIDQRVNRMLEKGLVSEVEKLLSAGYKDEKALNAVGYKEVVAYLNNEINYSEMSELIKRNTRRFAKRQLTWFRKDQRIQWIDYDKVSPIQAGDEILSAL